MADTSRDEIKSLFTTLGFEDDIPAGPCTECGGSGWSKRRNTRSEICKILIGHGHAPDKALEIAIDAERGVKHAIRWIKTVRDSTSK